jgi:phosphoribosylformimino-5-aminoimidazole carboxamide ribotide isomerase
LRNGRCVRLLQGKYELETVYSEDPVSMALRWQSLGAPRLHLVDLDGAASGELVNLEVIEQIVRAALIPVQVGGGIRRWETVGKLLKLGVDRVILGTAAVEQPELVGKACLKYGTSIAVSIDARDGKAAVKGWQEDSDVEAVELAQRMVEMGVKNIIYTDISRDGTLTEPNFAAIFEMVDELPIPVTASGGVSCLSHLKMLKKLGVKSVIIGKALYTDDVNLKQALEVLARR